MAEAETEAKLAESESKFLQYSGPKPGVKYPLSVVYCPPDSEFAFSFADTVTQSQCCQCLYLLFYSEVSDDRNH